MSKYHLRDQKYPLFILKISYISVVALGCSEILGYFCKCGITKTFANKCILECTLTQKTEFTYYVYTDQYFTYDVMRMLKNVSD